MAISIRHYLFPETGDPLRIPQKTYRGMVHDQDAMPEFAGTRQRVMHVFIDNDEGSPQEIVRTECAIWIFDDAGKIGDGLRKALVQWSASLPMPSDDENVVPLKPTIEKQKLQKEYRWEPTPKEITKVTGDIWPTAGAKPFRSLKGVDPRKPPLPLDAERTLNGFSDHFGRIAYAIDSLKEPSLKGLSFEARRRAKHEKEQAPLLEAVAQLADYRRQVLRRRKSGKGTWYAVVEIIRWDDHVGEGVASFDEPCKGREAAIVAVRRLLAEHSGKFAKDCSIEGRVVNELEWTDEASE